MTKHNKITWAKKKTENRIQIITKNYNINDAKITLIQILFIYWNILNMIW